MAPALRFVIETHGLVSTTARVTNRTLPYRCEMPECNPVTPPKTSFFVTQVCASCK